MILRMAPDGARKHTEFAPYLRHEVHKGTTKVERSHQFAKFLNFGTEGGLKTDTPEDQEKAIVYNELVANAVAVQTVADQTRALHELRRRGSCRGGKCLFGGGMSVEMRAGY
jgi:hypothetical protein